MKEFFLFSSMAVLVACAGGNSSQDAAVEPPKPKVTLDSYACPDNTDLRGEGIGQNADEALLLAQRQIANRIHSTVESNSSLNRVQSEDGNGNETVASRYEVNSQVYSRLENAQAARQIGKVEMDGGVGVVACMSVENAMKPFLDDFQKHSAKVALKAASFEASQHPLEKLAAYDSAASSYAGVVAARNVLDVFHYPHENPCDSAYNVLVENYRQFKSNYAFYYNPSNSGEMEMAVFARLSQKYHVVAGECKGGVLLSVEASEASCKDGSFGTSCSSLLTLTGSSCFGDSYFVQKTMVKGTGKYGKAEAEERLLQNVSSGEWFDLWAKVLNQWNVK